ncbi:unconventional myosin-X, partial [Tachysurus ichikawai]
KQYKKALSSIVTIQKNYRTHFYQRRFQRKRSAALVLQKCRRGQVARGRCRKLRDEKREREEEERKKIEEEKKKREEDGAQMKVGDSGKGEDEAEEGSQVSLGEGEEVSVCNPEQ